MKLPHLRLKNFLSDIIHIVKYFNSPTNGKMSETDVLLDIKKFVITNKEDVFRIIIGTDSLSNHESCNFVTAIVVHRIGSGAKYYWRKQNKKMKPVLRTKIYEETMISLNVAKDFVPKLQKNLNGSKYDFEIHIDVGNVGPTREMIKEVVGMVTGNGFVAKTKPQSWGASSVADRYT